MPVELVIPRSGESITASVGFWRSKGESVPFARWHTGRLHAEELNVPVEPSMPGQSSFASSTSLRLSSSVK